MSEPPAMAATAAAPATAGPAVAFRNVAKKFGGREVLAGVSFELPRGARWGLIGPNGAGKSVLLRLATGSLRPEAGEVATMGFNPWREPASARARLGFLPENAPLIGELSPREHLALAAALRGLRPGALTAEEDRLVEALALGSFYRRPAALLSQGQRRRAALASALLGSPPLLILDEPAVGLDPEEALRLLDLLRALPRTSALLLSSHVLSDLKTLADETLTLAGGRLTQTGPLRGEDEAALRRDYLSRTAETRPA